jgi:hypothetical protein
VTDQDPRSFSPTCSHFHLLLWQKLVDPLALVENPTHFYVSTHIHVYMSIYGTSLYGRVRFRRVSAPTGPPERDKERINRRGDGTSSHRGDFMTMQQKQALIERIRTEQALWEDFLAQVGEERMTQPGATDDWSFKDVVGHLNGWRTLTLAKLDVARRGDLQPPDPPWPAHLDEDDEENVEQINDWIYNQNRDRPLADLLQESRQQFVTMAEIVEALPESVLFDPNRFRWLKGYPLAAVVDGSFGHFHEEHEGILRAWLAEQAR